MFKIKPLVNINKYNFNGETSLFIAIDNGHTTIAKLLIENGACLTHIDHKLRTPLIAASLKGNYEIVESLLSHGAKISDYKPYKINALHIAAQNNDITLAELLLNNGADVNAISYSENKTPLHFANYDIAKFLIFKGAFIDSEDGWGNTLLHYAYIKNDKSLIDLLTANGASSEIKNRKGITPKQIRIYEIPRVVTILDMCPKCRSGKSGDISLNKWQEECSAGTFKCPYCGSLFSRITSNSTSISSLKIKWMPANDHSMHYETSHCPSCNGLSFHQHRHNFDYEPEAQIFDEEGFCRVCSNQKNLNENFNQLIEGLSAADIRTRGLAALKLGSLKKPEAVEPLISTLTDESEFVRNNAILSLGEIMDTRAVEPIISVLKNPNLSTRLYSVKALEKLRDKRAVEPIAELLKPAIEEDFAEEELVTEAITALTVIGNPEAVLHLSEFLKILIQLPLVKREYNKLGMVPLVERYAFNVVKALENLAMAEPLIEVLSIGPLEVKCRIINALGNIGDKRAVHFIIDAISKQRDFWLVHNAILSLEKLSDPSALEILNEILSEPDQKEWGTNSLHQSATLAIERIRKIN